MLQDAWAHYAEEGRPHELVPIWPSLSADRLWLVPRAHIAGSLVCVVAWQGTNVRALVLPARMSASRLSQVVRYLTGWEVAEVRLRLSLQVHLPLPLDVPCILRDGDVLDAVSPGGERSRHVARQPAELKSNVLWTRSILLQHSTFIRIWSPRMRPPILLCIAAGEHWDSAVMSFSGDFQANHPGRWVPVPWAPCRLPHFVQASEDDDCANVLFEEPCGVHCVTFDGQVTPFDITQGTSEHSRGVRVLGSPHIGAHVPLDLRDGDVVVTGPLVNAEDSAWPDLRSHTALGATHWLLRLLVCAYLRSWSWTCLAGLGLANAFAVLPRCSPPSWPLEAPHTGRHFTLPQSTHWLLAA